MDEKKIVIIGGTSGIGLAMAGVLSERKDVHVTVLGRNSSKLDKIQHVTFEKFDINKDNISILQKHLDADALIITAGIGRLAEFSTFTDCEIEKVINTNCTSILKIIRLFYPRLQNKKPFYCCVISSITGLLASPLYAVYSASKAALCKFIEGVNVELKMTESANIITNIAPGHLDGTSFEGKETNVERLIPLANKFIAAIESRQELYIPKYRECYQAVLARYHENPLNFGTESYTYKSNTARINKTPLIKVGYLSGTFDLFHVGHLNLLKRAKQYCDYLVVGVHKDASHKGKITFIPFEERMRIVGSIDVVDRVIESLPEDKDVYDQIIKYDYLFVGSDYKGTERFNRYEEYFKDKGVQIIYFPYTQGTSSTKLRLALDAIVKFAEK